MPDLPTKIPNLTTLKNISSAVNGLIDYCRSLTPGATPDMIVSHTATGTIWRPRAVGGGPAGAANIVRVLCVSEQRETITGTLYAADGTLGSTTVQVTKPANLSGELNDLEFGVHWQITYASTWLVETLGLKYRTISYSGANPLLTGISFQEFIRPAYSGDIICLKETSGSGDSAVTTYTDLNIDGRNWFPKYYPAQVCDPATTTLKNQVYAGSGSTEP